MVGMVHEPRQLLQHPCTESGAFMPISVPASVFYPEDARTSFTEVRGSPEDPTTNIWEYINRSSSGAVPQTPPHNRENNSAASNWSHQPYPDVETVNVHSSTSRSPSRESGHISLPEVPECIQKMITKMPEVTDKKKDAKEVIRYMKDISTYDTACEFVVSKMNNGDVCPSMWWKLCLELAELYKKGHLPQARIWLCLTIGLLPGGATGWTELAKIEEDLNQIAMAKALFKMGLQMCVGPERCTLSVKAMRLLELFPHEGSDLLVRKILGDAVRDLPPEKSWKVLLEGTLYEARKGNDKAASAIMACIMDAVPRQGTVYLEAAKLHEKNGNYKSAIEIVKRGLKANPKFGPLVFYGIRFLEKQAWAEYYEGEKYNEGRRKAYNKSGRASMADKLFDLAEIQEQEYRSIDLTPLHDFRKEAKKYMCSELVWKLHFEVAQAEERAAQYTGARRSFSMAFQECLPNLKWKVLVGGARMELAKGSQTVALLTLTAAFNILKPDQNKTMSIVKLELARYYEYTGHLDMARDTLLDAQGGDWRAYLEQVSLELRSGDGVKKALEVARRGVRSFKSSARLWAIIIQLTNELGKTGGGNPTALAEFENSKFSVRKAGEVWCEGARIHMDPLQPHLFNLDTAEEYLRSAMRYTPQYGDSFIEMAKLCFLKYGKTGPWVNSLMSGLALAEPNYGPLWQACKHSPLLTCQEVLVHAMQLLQTELHIYSEFFTPLLLPSTVRLPLDDFPPWLFTTALPSVTYQFRFLATLPNATRRRLIFGCEPITS